VSLLQAASVTDKDSRKLKAKSVMIGSSSGGSVGGGTFEVSAPKGFTQPGVCACHV
jgi:hypothetical protein